MKKTASILSIVMLLMAIVLPMNASAVTARGSLSGPSTIRVGDQITVTYSISGSGLLGVEGYLNYDSSVLSPINKKQVIASPWMVEFQGASRVVAYDNTAGTSPITSARSVFSATFMVKNVPVGTKTTVSFVDSLASDGDSEVQADATYTATVAAPLPTTTKAPPVTQAPKTGNANLGSLTVSNATISPAFKPSVTRYTASVDFSVDKLDVQGKTEDPTSKVSINSTKLNVGVNTIKINVTAQGGATKTYTIQVTRAQDPNAPTVPTQPADTNKKLSGLTVAGFVLSPAFNPNIKEYVVWLPYETDKIEVSGIPASEKSKVTVEGGTSLVAGKANKVKIICTAEDGTKETYVLTAMRAPKSGVYNEDYKPASSDKFQTQGIQLWLVIVLCTVFLMVGVIITYLVFGRVKGHDGGPYDDDSNDDLDSDPDLDDNYTNSKSQKDSHFNNSKPAFKGVSFPSSTKEPNAVDDKANTYDDAKQKTVGTSYQQPQKPAYTPPTSSPRVFTTKPETTNKSETASESKSNSAYTPPTPSPRVFTAKPETTNKPETASESKFKPAYTPAPPVSNAAPEKIKSDDIKMGSDDGLGLPYTPARPNSSTQTPPQKQQSEDKTEKRIPRNPFELSADD